MCLNNMNEICLFCKIIDGSESAQIVFKDDNVIAFFPRIMNTKGHMIIAPVQHCADLFDIRNDVLSSLMEVTRFLAKHCQHQLGADGINLLHASGESGQQSMPHFHFHLLPRFENDNLDAWPNLPVWDGDSTKLLKKLKVIVNRT